MVFVVLLTEENDQLKLVLEEEYMIVIHVHLLPYLHLTLVDRTFAHCWFYWSWLSRHLLSPIEFHYSYMYFDLLAVGPDLVYSPISNHLSPVAVNRLFMLVTHLKRECLMDTVDYWADQTFSVVILPCLWLSIDLYI